MNSWVNMKILMKENKKKYNSNAYKVWKSEGKNKNNWKQKENRVNCQKKKYQRCWHKEDLDMMKWFHIDPQNQIINKKLKHSHQ